MGRMGWLENWEIEALNWIEWNTSSTGSETGILNPADLLHILATK